jgi:hypothetical protein
MDRTVTFIGTFRIPDAATWLPAIDDMAAFVEANVPGVQSFHAYATPDGTHGTVVYVHPNGDSLDQHLEAAAERIASGSEMVEVTSVQLLGVPNPGTVERMRSMGVPLTVMRHVRGFDRPEAVSRD